MEGIKIFEREEFGTVRVVDVNGEPWFVARDVAQALGYVDTTQAIRMHCEKSKDFRGVEMTATATPMKIIPEEDVYALIFGSHLESAKKFRRWLCDEVLPSIRKTGGYSMAPKTYAEALRALAAEVELREAVEAQKALAESQRDEAIRTKAEIGSRREATSMATASAAIRQRDALADKLGEGKHWKSVKAIPWLLEVFGPSRGMYSVVGKKLAQLGERMGKPSREIEDATYGTIKAHHVDVIEAFRLELEKDGNMMGKYRRA